MKKLMTLLVVLFSSLQMFAQGAPQKVMDAFKAKYPDATEVKWSNKLTRFTAWFTYNGERLKANFNDDGAWKDTEFEMSFDALPTVVKDGFKKSQYADWTVDNVTRVEGEGRTKMYRIEAKTNAANRKNLFFDEKGSFVREGRTF